MTTSHHVWKLPVPILLITILLCGCITHRNIVPSGQYPTDYVIGDVYRFKQDLVANPGDSPLFSHHKEFMPQGTNDCFYPGPSDLKTHPQDFSGGSVLIPAGTLVQIERFDLERNPYAIGPMVWIYGSIIGGPLAGNRLMISFISVEAGHSPLDVRLLMVDTNYLERVKTP